jgi:cell fate regulator YaaT (PSP1 superfamily)
MTETVLEIERPTVRAVAGVRFHKIGKVYHFDYSAFPDLQVNDWVVVETARGRQMGEVVAFAAAQDEEKEYKSILRRATPRDLMLRQYWQVREVEALEVCRRKASEMGVVGGGLKYVAAMYNFDGSLLTFLYTADDKANVTKLWQELNRQFPAQIEMRQIGPRDVAKLLGGFGACGELRCCSTFLTDFSPVSIKMAKMQGISLNPTEITGMCGRLRCCLVYEYEQYVAARQLLPKKNKRVGTPHGEGKVIDVMPMQDAVLVLVADGFQTVKREDLIPLEELEALAKKAGEPCNKHGDGPCECGAKPGKAAESAAEADDAVGDDLPDDERINLAGIPLDAELRGQPPVGDARPAGERGDRRRRNRRDKRGDGQPRQGGSAQSAPKKGGDQRQTQPSGGQPRTQPGTQPGGQAGNQPGKKSRRRRGKPKQDAGGANNSGGAPNLGGE